MDGQEHRGRRWKKGVHHIADDFGGRRIFQGEKLIDFASQEKGQLGAKQGH